MPISSLAKTSIALALSATATAASAVETVHFTSLDGAINLTAFVRVPEFLKLKLEEN